MQVASLPGRQFKGRIDYVYPTVTAATRTVRLRLKVANADGLLKPNMYATVTVIGKPGMANPVIPREALIRSAAMDRVVLALGRRGTPRKLGVAGEEMDKVFYDIVEMEAFAGQRVLVVGGGDSAIESVLGLANQPNTTVTLSYRGKAWDRVKERNREKLERAIAAGKVTPLLESTVREVRHDVVVLDLADGSTILPNDFVVIRIGGDPPNAMLERLGVRIVEKELATGAKAG